MARNRLNHPEIVWCSWSGRDEQAPWYEYLVNEDLYMCVACGVRCQDQNHLKSKRHNNRVWWWCMGDDTFPGNRTDADLNTRRPNPAYRWEWSPKGKGGAQAAQGGKGGKGDNGGKGKEKDKHKDKQKDKQDDTNGTAGNFAAAAWRATTGLRPDGYPAPDPGGAALGAPATHPREEPDQPAAAPGGAPPDQPADHHPAGAAPAASEVAPPEQPAAVPDSIGAGPATYHIGETTANDLTQKLQHLQETIESVQEDAMENNVSLTEKVDNIQAEITKLHLAMRQVETTMWDINITFRDIKEMMRSKFDANVAVAQGPLRRSQSGSLITNSRAGAATASAEPPASALVQTPSVLRPDQLVSELEGLLNVPATEQQSSSSNS